MRYLVALFLPWLVFFTIGRPFQGILCLILQLTLIGWPIAAIWAVLSTNRYYDDRRHRDVVRAMRRK